MNGKLVYVITCVFIVFILSSIAAWVVGNVLNDCRAEEARVKPFINHTMLYVTDGHADLVTVLGIADTRGRDVRLLVRKDNGDTFGCWSDDLLPPPPSTSPRGTP